MVKPAEGTPAGTAHVLCYRDGTGEKVFIWTGKGWSTRNGSPYYTEPIPMKVAGWKYSRPATPEPAAPPAVSEAANASNTASDMRSFSRLFTLDGDLLRCKGCNRGIHVSRHLEPMVHASECPLDYHEYPWQLLLLNLSALQPITHSIVTITERAEPPAVTQSASEGDPK